MIVQDCMAAARSIQQEFGFQAGYSYDAMHPPSRAALDPLLSWGKPIMLLPMCLEFPGYTWRSAQRHDALAMLARKWTRFLNSCQALWITLPAKIQETGTATSGGRMCQGGHLHVDVTEAIEADLQGFSVCTGLSILSFLTLKDKELFKDAMREFHGIDATELSVNVLVFPSHVEVTLLVYDEFGMTNLALFCYAHGSSPETLHAQYFARADTNFVLKDGLLTSKSVHHCDRQPYGLLWRHDACGCFGTLDSKAVQANMG